MPIPNVDNVFTQLEAALCLLARAKGEVPAKAYFLKQSTNVSGLILDGGIFQVVITVPDEQTNKE
jgi:hypothetical protein